MSDDKINVVGTNIREKATVIWNVANHLFGYFKPPPVRLFQAARIRLGHSSDDGRKAVSRLPVTHMAGGSGYIRKGKAPRGHRRLLDASLGLSVLQHKQVHL